MRMSAIALALAFAVPVGAHAQSSSSTITPAPAAPPSATITPAPNQPAAPAPTPVQISPEAMKAAKELTAVLGIETQAKTILGQVRDQVIQATVNASGKSIAEASAIADEVVMPDFAAKQGELADLLVVPWALGFTPQEMHELTAFYNSTLGKRVHATMPKITQQSLQIGQQWTQKTFREAVEKHKDELHKRGLKF